MHQHMDKNDTMPGGGNAIARPFRSTGAAFGMPTGRYGGFGSLDDDAGHGMTAKQAIDDAAEQIIQSAVDQPGRYDTIYYCINRGDPEELIGMGIFNIDYDVRVYIRDSIRALPKMIRNKAIEKRRLMRA